MEADVIIIGAGPAGLFTAIQCSQNNKKAVILEKNSTCGKKLLITGSGQCNLTHAGNIEDFFNHYGNNNRFLMSSLYGYSNQNLINFFKKRNINFVTTDENKIFSSTYKAKDILDVLLQECSKHNVEIKTNEAVQQVEHSKESNNFKTITQHNKYTSKYLVIATGGRSYPATGSSGDGYSFAKSLGHTIIQPRPALTPLYIRNYQFSDISGISLSNIGISLWRQNKLIKRWSGDILFTHQGISGPGIINYSRYVKPSDTIKLNLINTENEAVLDRNLIEKMNVNGKMLFKNLLKELAVPSRLSVKLMEKTGISQNKKASQIAKDKRKKLVKLFFALPLTVERLGHFKEAMVTAGGINLKEINPQTMESRIIPNLFAVGEVLDIDGDTGGYNLQAAFSTGYSAGQAILCSK